MLCLLLASSLQAQKLPDPPAFSPLLFVDGPITNPLFPLPRGAIWVFEGHEGRASRVDSVFVMPYTRLVAGVTATIVRDVVRERGRVVEETFDWYAQDTAGAVWYLGEATMEFGAGGETSDEGSWEADVDGARAGIVMPANPRVGDFYRQEYRKGVAEDVARVIGVGESANVKAGRFTGCVMTEDWSPLEPKVRERKTYCPGVGLVRETKFRGGFGRSELVSVRNP